jgi:hypothetical protein
MSCSPEVVVTDAKRGSPEMRGALRWHRGHKRASVTGVHHKHLPALPMTGPPPSSPCYRPHLHLRCGGRPPPACAGTTRRGTVTCGSAPQEARSDSPLQLRHRTGSTPLPPRLPPRRHAQAPRLPPGARCIRRYSHRHTRHTRGPGLRSRMMVRPCDRGKKWVHGTLLCAPS